MKSARVAPAAAQGGPEIAVSGPRGQPRRTRAGAWTTTSRAGPASGRDARRGTLLVSSVCPIPLHRIADLAARDEAEPGTGAACRICTRRDNQCDVTAMGPGSRAEGVLELRTAADATHFAEPLGLHTWPAGAAPAGRRVARARATRATRRSGASAPSRDDASGRAGRFSCSCAPGSRECDGDDDGLAGTYVS